MVSFVPVEGYRDYINYVENIESDSPPTYFYFYGTRMSNGHSWCDDSAYVEPIIRSYLRELRDYVIFVFVGVGYRNDWTTMSCPFRNDKRLRLTVIPTIIKHGSSQRLEGNQCTNREFLDMIFDKQTLDGDKVRESSSRDEITRSQERHRQNNDLDEDEALPRYRSRRRVRSVDDYHPYYDPSETRQQDSHHSRQRHAFDPVYKSNYDDQQYSRQARELDSRPNPEDYPQSSAQHQDNSRYRERTRYGRRPHSS